MIVRGSAFEHGVLEEDGVNAATWPVWDDGTEELIHAMRARPQYVRMLG